MFGSLYSFPRGLVLVSTRGFCPKIISITLPKSEMGMVQELPHSKGEMLWGGCSPCCDPGRQSTQDTTRKKAQSELLEILACPKDMLKWFSHGKSISLIVLPSTVHPNRCKSRQVRVVHWHSVLLSSHSFQSCYFVRKTRGKESWRAAVLI